MPPCENRETMNSCCGKAKLHLLPQPSDRPVHQSHLYEILSLKNRILWVNKLKYWSPRPIPLSRKAYLKLNGFVTVCIKSKMTRTYHFVQET